MAQLSTKFRVAFIVFNVVYFMIGVVMLSFGVYSIVNLEQYGSFTDTSYIAGAAIFISVGIVKMVLGAAAIITCFIQMKWQCFIQTKWLLGIYTIMLLILMLLTFVAAIYGFLRIPDAYFITRDRLGSAYESQENYMQNFEDVATVQSELNCCGFNSTEGEEDYALIGLDVGNNCTGVTRPFQETVFKQGCLVYLANEIQDDLYNVGVIGFSFGTFELTSFLVAMQNLEGLI